MRRDDETVRVFCGIFLPVSVESTWAEWMTCAQKQTPGAWVPVQNVHCTILFIGDIRKNRLPQIADGLTTIMAKHHAFNLTILKKPRLFGQMNEKGWQPLVFQCRRTEAVRSIHEDAARAVARMGYHQQKRAFSPHITIARIHHGTTIDIPPISHIILHITRIVVAFAHTRNRKPLYTRWKTLPLK